jgi:hypothetical protein
MRRRALLYAWVLACAALAAPAAAQEKQDATADQGAGDADAKPASRVRRATLLELGFTGGAFSRSFDYTDDLFGALRPYELEAAGFVALDGWFFPIEAGDFRHIGITGRYEHAFPPVSQTRDGRSFDTRSSSWQAGLTGRFPLGNHELGAVLAYGRHAFSVSGDEAADTGELEADVWFPRLSAQAIDFRGFIGYRLLPALHFIAGAELRRYAF